MGWGADKGRACRCPARTHTRACVAGCEHGRTHAQNRARAPWPMAQVTSRNRGSACTTLDGRRQAAPELAASARVHQGKRRCDWIGRAHRLSVSHGPASPYTRRDSTSAERVCMPGAAERAVVRAHSLAHALCTLTEAHFVARQLLDRLLGIGHAREVPPNTHVISHHRLRRTPAPVPHGESAPTALASCGEGGGVHPRAFFT